jgi:COP9 signalosome complex subunit 7
MSELGGGGAEALEGFEVLAKGGAGAAVVMVIQQVLKHPQIFVFGELLELQSIKDLEQDEAHKPFLDALRMFAYGTFKEYKAMGASLPALGKAEETKLKQLTIVSLAAAHKSLPYPTLLRELSMESVRELEDLIIECIYSGLLTGSLDQIKRALEVQSTMGRDIAPGEVDGMLEKLDNWMQASDATEKHLGKLMQVATEQQEAKRKEEADLTSQKEGVIKAIQLDKDEGSGKGEGQGKKSSRGGALLGSVMGFIGGGNPKRERSTKRLGGR